MVYFYSLTGSCPIFLTSFIEETIEEAWASVLFKCSAGHLNIYHILGLKFLKLKKSSNGTENNVYNLTLKNVV